MTQTNNPSNIDVSHLARLARLQVDAEAEHATREDLERIIAMIDSMQAVDTSGVLPMAHPHDATARLRADQVTENVDPERFQRGAPATQDGYYLVPRVVE